jgi:hypothetical protein
MGGSIFVPGPSKGIQSSSPQPESAGSADAGNRHLDSSCPFFCMASCCSYTPPTALQLYPPWLALP